MPTVTQEVSLEASFANASDHGATSRKLPYQPNQRVEFLHLQAETEALLQKLYIEQHRRSLCETQSSL